MEDNTECRAVEIEHNYSQSKIFPDKNASALCFFFSLGDERNS